MVRTAYPTRLKYKVRAVYPSRDVPVFSLVLAVLVSNLDAVHAANEERAAQVAEQTIELWTYSEVSVGENAALNASADSYNALPHGYRVGIRAFDKSDYIEQVINAAANGSLPCLLEADGPVLYSLAWRGYLQPIEHLLPKSLLDDVLPSILAQGHYDGRLYSLGQFDSGLALWGNRRLLNNAGVRIPTLQAPWTLAEFEQVLDKLGKLPGVVAAIEMGTNARSGEFYSYAFSPILQGFGGDLVDREYYRSAKGKLDGPQAVAAMSHFQQWFKNGWARQDVEITEVNGRRKIVLTRPDQPETDYFANGKAALSWQGHWRYRWYSEALGRDLMLLPMPDFGRGVKTGMGSWSIAVSSTCSDPKAAAAFLSFLMSEPEIRGMTDVNGAVPARRSVLAKSPLYGKDGPLRLYMLQLEAGLAVPRPQTPAYDSISKVFANAVVAIIAGADVQTELSRAAALIDRDIADNLGYPAY